MKSALLVGIEHYQAGSGIADLRFACADAHALQKVLIEHCGFEKATVLADRTTSGATSSIMPTDGAIVQSLEKHSQELNEEDLFLFFFAGHGIEKSVNGRTRSLLLAHNANLRHNLGFLDIALLRHSFSEIRCRQVVIILDCCRSEHVAGRTHGRNLMGDRLIGNVVNACAGRAVSGSTTVLMSACQRGQSAHEWEDEGQGAFTAFLKRGIEGQAWQDGILAVDELSRHVSSEVSRWSQKMGYEQNPDFHQKGSPRPIILGRKEEKPGGPTQGLTPTNPRALQTWFSKKESLEYIFIPPGFFDMGASPDDHQAESSELPRRRVTVKQGFWIARSPVTVASYRRFCDETGRILPPAPVFNPNWNHGDHPMVNAGWDDINAYLRWADCRLPSEAEWEYAARAGTEWRYWWGPDFDPAHAWYLENSEYSTQPVDRKPPNPWQIHDMLGNTWERCADSWHETFEGAPDDSRPWIENDYSCVYRGGAWHLEPTELRISTRKGPKRSRRQMDDGFRCVKDADNCQIRPKT